MFMLASLGSPSDANDMAFTVGMTQPVERSPEVIGRSVTERFICPLANNSPFYVKIREPRFRARRTARVASGLRERRWRHLSDADARLSLAAWARLKNCERLSCYNPRSIRRVEIFALMVH